MKPGSLTINGILLSLVLLLAGSCRKEGRECNGTQQQSFSISNFKRINAGDNLQLTIKKGDTFAITAEGCASDLADLDLSIGNGDMLHITYRNPGQAHAPVTFTITMPQMLHIILSGVARAHIEGFAGQSTVIRTMLSGESQCVVSGTAINANFDLAGASQLTLTGNTESLYGAVSGTSVLNSYGLVATEVDMTASGSAVAYVFPQSYFFATASENSRIFYKGSPAQKFLETTGTAQITQQ